MRWIAVSGWLAACIFFVLWLYTGPFRNRPPAPPADVRIDTPRAGTSEGAPLEHPAAHRRLTVTVLAGAALPDRDPVFGRSDVFVVVGYDGREKLTSIREGTHPKWNESFEFNYVANAPLRITAWDRDALENERIGGAQLLPDPQKPGEVDLALDDGGSIRIAVRFE